MSENASQQSIKNFTGKIPLWSTAAPHALGDGPADVPMLTFYSPTANPTGAAVIVCPGGGYGGLAGHENEPIARWLASLGIYGIVLEYRLGPRYRHPVPMLDAARAIRTIRARSGELGIDPKRIGILGFSAGGHLASTISTHGDDGDPTAGDTIDRFSSWPNLAILLYPVITFADPFAERGSRRNLLGENPSRELILDLSNELRVSSRTPPTFLFHTVDDAPVPVENSLLYASALRKTGITFEMHLYEHGPHGVGLAENNPVLGTWPERCAAWLKGRGF